MTEQVESVESVVEPTPRDSGRKLARIKTITAINPIDGADRIEQVEVGGWSCVTGKGNFNVGDQCFYFEPDAMVPVDHPAFAFLAERSTRQVNGRTVHVLRTIRLKGAYSQGLVLPLKDFDLGSFAADLSSPDIEDQDFSEIFGITKYEPQVRGSGSKLGQMKQEGLFPTHLIMKTDSERVQNLSRLWPELVESGPWVWSEKLDGTSFTAIRDGEVLRVCSRNFELKRSENVYWKIVDLYGLESILVNDGDFVQGEITGPSVQNNPLNLAGLGLFAFSARIAGVTLLPGGFPPSIPSAPVIKTAPLPATIRELLEFTDGIKSILNPSKLAEGIVFHHPEGKRFHKLGYRSNFKAVSRAYEASLGKRIDTLVDVAAE